MSGIIDLNPNFIRYTNAKTRYLRNVKILLKNTVSFVSFDEKKWDKLYDNTKTKGESLYENVNSIVQKDYKFIFPIHVFLALRNDVKKIDNMMVNLLSLFSNSMKNKISSYLEIESIRYGNVIKKYFQNITRISTTVDFGKTASIARRVEMNSFFNSYSYHQRENKYDLVCSFGGIHHNTDEYNEKFYETVIENMNENCLFILREHDIIDENSMDMTILAHTLFSASFGVSEKKDGEEIMNFKSAKKYIEFFEHLGLRYLGKSGPLTDDPTRQTLLLFRKGDYNVCKTLYNSLYSTDLITSAASAVEYASVINMYLNSHTDLFTGEDALDRIAFSFKTLKLFFKVSRSFPVAKLFEYLPMVCFVCLFDVLDSVYKYCTEIPLRCRASSDIERSWIEARNDERSRYACFCYKTPFYNYNFLRETIIRIGSFADTEEYKTASMVSKMEYAFRSFYTIYNSSLLNVASLPFKILYAIPYFKANQFVNVLVESNDTKIALNEEIAFENASKTLTLFKIEKTKLTNFSIQLKENGYKILCIGNLNGKIISYVNDTGFNIVNIDDINTLNIDLICC